VAWLQIRIAENLEALGHRSAAAGQVDGQAAVGASVAAGRALSVGGGAPGRPGDPSEAARAVRDAEDARLRLLATGLTPDPRWAEPEALVAVAARALDRGEHARAIDLARRAVLVFEVLRLTRIGADAALPADAGAGAPGGRSPALAARWAELSRHWVSAADTGCGPDLQEAERLLRQAETRPGSAAPAAGDEHLAEATARLERCAEREREVVEERVAPLRAAAEEALSETADPALQARLSRGIAESDAAVARGDLRGAQASLLSALAGVPGAAAAVRAASTPPAVRPDALVADAADDGAAADGEAPDESGVAPVPPSGELGGDRSGRPPAADADAGTAPRSRIISNILQPL
jgi:hypothetical protein